MHSLIQLKRGNFVFLVVLACFGLSPASMAVSPPPDGGYPGFHHGRRTNALKNFTTGIGNTAAGCIRCLRQHRQLQHRCWRWNASIQQCRPNTAIGAGALLNNTNGDRKHGEWTFALFSTRQEIRTRVKAGERCFRTQPEPATQPVVARRFFLTRPASKTRPPVVLRLKIHNRQRQHSHWFCCAEWQHNRGLKHCQRYWSVG